MDQSINGDELTPKSSPKTYAVMDVGTNSTRLLIFKEEKGKLIRINKSVRYTRMGQGVDDMKMLHPDAQKRNTEVLEEYMTIASDYEVSAFYVYATSAMREAHNSKKYQRAVKKRLGLEIDIISGAEEARLGFMGVSQSFHGKILIFDIGGGSTEFILGENDAITKMISLKIGCVKVTEKYLLSDPPKKTEIEALNQAIKKELNDQLKNIIPADSYELIGIGGTATSLSTIKQGLGIYDSEKIHNSQITREELEDLIAMLGQKTIDERQEIIGLEAKRADIILGGALILLNILDISKDQTFTICDYDNLEGAAFKEFIAIK